MSLEERMAYYREKYDIGGQSAARPESGQTEQRRDKSGRRRDHQKGRGKRERTAREQSAENVAAAPSDTTGPDEAPGAAKKGMFSRLLGIFRKKPE